MIVKYQTRPLAIARQMPFGPSSLRAVSSRSMAAVSDAFSPGSSHFACCGLFVRNTRAAMPASTARMPSPANMTCQPWNGVTWSPMLMRPPDSGAPIICENGCAR